jgi:hypothetical protein
MNAVQRIQDLVAKPMPVMESVEYFASVEGDLRNRVLASLHRMYIDLKIYDFLLGELDSATASHNDRKGPTPIIAD